MNREEMLALFTLAGLPVEGHWQLPNEYWPDAGGHYDELRKKSPWWLVKTPYGLIKLGWRKRVINIDWKDTKHKAAHHVYKTREEVQLAPGEVSYHVRKGVTSDNVTKDEHFVHAWSYAKAVEYLTTLARQLKQAVDEATKIEQKQEV